MSEESSPTTAIAEIDRNCWRIEPARRFAFLVDAAAYFETLAGALEQARESVLILGWDVHSRMRLRRNAPRRRSELAALLDRVVRRRPELNVHVLTWDFAMVFAMEREFLSVARLDWKTHARVHVQYDAHHPTGASHHQKVVVIDDALAFVGGLDLTMRRWDTPEHRAADERRTDPHGTPYGPFHDVQCMFDGRAAAAMGELVRERWRRATGDALPVPDCDGPPWPDGVEPDVTGVSIAISRTEPEFHGRPAVREIEMLYRDAIASARRSIYIENQYLSSDAIRQALEASLRRAEGPEVVLILPERHAGWLERYSLEKLRQRLLYRLCEADVDDRLRVYSPAQRGLDDGHIVMVHSKICVVDDELVTVGSANLSNRSMGLDTECNVWIEARGDAAVRSAIAGIRQRLLAEHLGVDRTRFARAERDAGSVIAAVESLCGGRRSLMRVPAEECPPEDELVADPAVLDPERPIPAAEMAQLVFGAGEPRPRRRGWPLLLALVAALVALTAAWRWTPLGEWASPERVAGWIEAYRSGRLALAGTVALYVVAGFALLPLTVLIAQTGVVFDPWEAVLHATVGSMASAAASYGVGRALGRRFGNLLAGKGVTRIIQVLQRQGVLRVALIRMIPVAPYSAVNLIAGASGLPFWIFMAGTLLGLAPGILALTLLGGQLARTLRDPSWLQLALLTAAAIAVVGGLSFVSRKLRQRFASWGEDDGATAG